MELISEEWLERTIDEAISNTSSIKNVVERFNRNPPEKVKKIRAEIEYLNGIEAIFAERMK